MKGIAALVQLKQDTGLSNTALSKLLNVPYDTLASWSCGQTKPSNDGLLFLAVKLVRKNLAEQLVKEKVQEAPQCPFCGQDIILSEISRGKFKVYHQCERSGLTIKVPPKSKDLVLFALTKIVSKEIIDE